MIQQVLDRLAGRVKQRKTTARETVEQAARAIAAGKSVDEAAIESALFEGGFDVDDLGRLAQFYADRAQKLTLLESLGPARRRLATADEKIEAENTKWNEITEAYRKRLVSLRAEADAAGKDVEIAREARGWLLEPANCPPSLKDDYRRLVDEEQAARVALGDAERELRRIREGIRSEKSWVDQLTDTGKAETRLVESPSYGPDMTGRLPLVASMSQQLERHQQQLKRFERALPEAEKSVATAQAALTAAEGAVAKMRDRILKH